MAEPEHQRVAAGIDQFVDPARLEPVRNVDVAVGRHDRLDGALVVEAGTAFDPGKTPAFRGYRFPLVVGIAPPRQPRLARVERHRRMAAHSGKTVIPGRSAMYSVRTSPVTGPWRSRATGKSSSSRPFPGKRSPCQASQTTV